MGRDSRSLVHQLIPGSCCCTHSLIVHRFFLFPCPLPNQQSRSRSKILICVRMDDFDLFDESIIEKQFSSIEEENQKLKDKMDQMKQRQAVLEKENRILKANISSLYKTAIAEVDRKNSQINELRSELDDLILRRDRRAK